MEFDNNENKKNVKTNEDNISENSTKIEESNQIKLINGFSPDKTLGYESFYTIDQIFEFIDSKLDDDPEFHDIDYSSDYGYPNYLFFDMSRMIADEEISYYIKDLKPLK